MQSQVKAKLATLRSKISFTLNYWTSEINTKTFLGITAHWIDDDWIMHNIILDFVNISEMTHTGANLVKMLEQVINDLLLNDDRIIGVVCDNASNNGTLFGNLQKYQLAQVRCFGHILNLVVQDALCSINDSIITLWEIIWKIKNSVQRQAQLTTAYKSSGISILKPLLDVSTRWNSTYMMLEYVIKICKVRY